MRDTETTSRVLDVEGVSQRYGANTALDDVSMHVDSGELVGVLGVNGAGKTTLLESIIGARPLGTGRIRVAGVDVGRHRHRAAAHMALQPQGSALFKHLTVTETITLWHDLYDDPMPCEDVLERVGLRELRDAKVKNLSGGQQQRLRLGLALVGNTELVMFDEPTVGLDPVVRELVWDVIRERSRYGAALLTTQLMDEAEALCDRVIILDGGRVTCQGSVDSLIREFAHDGSVSFTTESSIGLDGLRDLDGVVMATERRVGRVQSVRLITRDQTSTRRAIAASNRLDVRQYRTAPPTFSDVFLSVVSDTAGVIKEGELR